MRPRFQVYFARLFGRPILIISYPLYLCPIYLAVTLGIQEFNAASAEGHEMLLPLLQIINIMLHVKAIENLLYVWLLLCIIYATIIALGLEASLRIQDCILKSRVSMAKS